jgi:hypothetical protein
MLESFLKVASAHHQQREHRRNLSELMDALPEDVLQKIATGELKLAYGDGDSWLDQFKGTPLLEKAIGLEQEGLQVKMQEKERREANDENLQETDKARDELCIKKKMLELELAGQETQEPPAEEPAPAPEAPPPQTSETPTPVAGPPGMGGSAVKTSSVKEAKKGDTNWAAVAGLPPALAATGAGVGSMAALAKKQPILSGAKRWGAIGGGVGVAAAGLIGIGKLLEKADPSGKSLETAVKLAPAALTMGAAMMDKESAAQNFKLAAAKMLNPQVAMAEEWGREMAKADMEKISSPQFRLRQAYTEMEKDAGLEAAGAGLVGAGKHLIKALRGTAKAGYTRGGASAGRTLQRNVATGVEKVKRFATKNPGTTAALAGAGGLGVGYGLGR